MKLIESTINATMCVLRGRETISEEAMVDFVWLQIFWKQNK